ncbi:hypothetical protein HanRHA438_Chr13g0601231 [Helianthus annuus]|uniref:Uncharacterized protein n=1 Tax=Helianthus annuus TaxID=4232 RepID=A0A9K3EI49_HELAN|nr:hypothetical protein HanXRQr2_Chr13g0590511 [Helianthus annuus]KAJ0477092.1 hypothetical protein HanHA300_Chr13g0484471 [Helianthus annuus]KAJ0481460.1 hypothetical protein HanIR_Chr13g0642791 [Helianthus annuus]KAJ0497913.1 hypothetical protein HanHA89_Chr13g0516441 [Helianthus annuus]KAJ0663920.1 hypothetical protein HanLR1_Chr13g0486341 [Helianthus annuus]
MAGFRDLRLQFFALHFGSRKMSLKSKIKAAHSYAFPDSSTLVALDERPNLEELADEAWFWGAFGLYAFISMESG